MLKCHKKSIRGMAIACVVVSGLAVLGMLIGAIAIAAIGPAAINSVNSIQPSAFDVNVYGLAGEHLYDLSDVYGTYDLSGLTGTAAAATIGMIVGVCIYAAIMSAVCLVAGILVLRWWDDPRNYGKIVGWSIAGAICGGLGAGTAPLVLFIVIAVFANKDKKLYAQGYVTDASGYFYAPSGSSYVYPNMPVPPAQPIPSTQPGASAQSVQGEPLSGQGIVASPISQPIPAPAPMPSEQPMEVEAVQAEIVQSGDTQAEIVQSDDVQAEIVQPEIAITQPPAPSSGDDTGGMEGGQQ